MHTGAGWGSGDQIILNDLNRVDLEGVFAGASLARDWQTGNVVFGIVVDISKSDFSGFSMPFGNEDGGFETKVDWFGTVRGKLGYATGPYLLYATGGLAYGRVKATQGDLDGGTFDPNFFVTGSETRVGWAAGGGIDVAAVGSNLILGVEYLYVDLGDDTMTLAGNVGGPVTARVDVDAQVHTVRANLRYKF